MSETEYVPVEVDQEQIKDLLGFLQEACEGPRDAYALLVCGLIGLNAIDAKLPIDELVEQVVTGLRTFSAHGASYASH